MGREPGKAGRAIREQCWSDPSEGKDGSIIVSQSAMQDKEGLPRLLGSPQTKACHLRASVSFRHGPVSPSHWLHRSSWGRPGVGTTVVMDFRVQKLGSLVK